MFHCATSTKALKTNLCFRIDWSAFQICFGNCNFNYLRTKSGVVQKFLSASIPFKINILNKKHKRASIVGFEIFQKKSLNIQKTIAFQPIPMFPIQNQTHLLPIFPPPALRPRPWHTSEQRSRCPTSPRLWLVVELVGFNSWDYIPTMCVDEHLKNMNMNILNNMNHMVVIICIFQSIPTKWLKKPSE